MKCKSFPQLQSTIIRISAQKAKTFLQTLAFTNADKKNLPEIA